MLVVDDLKGGIAPGLDVSLCRSERHRLPAVTCSSATLLFGTLSRSRIFLVECFFFVAEAEAKNGMVLGREVVL